MLHLLSPRMAQGRSGNMHHDPPTQKTSRMLVANLVVNRMLKLSRCDGLLRNERNAWGIFPALWQRLCEATLAWARLRARCASASLRKSGLSWFSEGFDESG